MSRITAKAYLVIFFIILLLALAWGGYRHQLKKTLKRDISEQTLASDKAMVELGADFIAADRQRILNALSLTAGDAAFGQALLENQKDVIRFLLAALAAGTDCDLLLILDPTGEEVLRWSSSEVPADVTPADYRLPETVTVSHKPTAVVIESEYGGKRAPAVVFSAPILDKEGRTTGVLTALQDPPRWRDFLIRLAGHRDEFAFYLFSGSVVLAQSHPDHERAASIARLIDRLPHASDPEASGYGDLVQDGDLGEPLFISTAKAPDPDWTLILAHDYRKVMAPLETLFGYIDAFVGLLLVGFGVAGAPIYERCVVRKKALDQAVGEVRRLENEIRTLTERYTQLVRGLPDAIFETNPDGKIAFVSRSVSEILGFRPEGMIGMDWSNWIYPEDQATFRKAWAQSRDEAEFSISALRHVTSQGTLRYLTLYFIPLIGATGRLEGWNGVARDVTREVRRSDRVRELSRQLIQGQEEERRRLALDLHDEMGQVLSALKIGLQSLVEEGSAPDNPARPEIIRLIELTQTIMDRIRSLSYSLHPAILENFGLSAAIEDLCETSSETSGIAIDFKSADVGEQRMTREVKTTLFRFVQEALTNAIKHSRTPRIDVDLGLESDKLIITIRDYGRGFEVDRTLAQAPIEKKLGLWGMSERLGLAGGQLNIESGPGGTTLRAEIFVDGTNDGRIQDSSR